MLADTSLAASAHAGAGEFGFELRAAQLGHLGGAVEDLAAEVGARFGPAGLRFARGDGGVAEVLARGDAVVAERGPAIGRTRRGDAAAFAAREFAADVELVGLEDGETRGGLGHAGI